MKTVTNAFAKLSSVQDEGRTLVPDADIDGVLRHDRRYFHVWFEKLADANIVTLRDLWRYTPEQLFAAAPTSEANKKRFMEYVNDGVIDLRYPVRRSGPTNN